jgi:hypothetical protein
MPLPPAWHLLENTNRYLKAVLGAESGQFVTRRRYVYYGVEQRKYIIFSPISGDLYKYL